MAHSSAVGDYLKAIYKLHKGEERVTTVALATRLGVSPASASEMIKKLASQELIEHIPYYGVRLTKQGTADALELIRHHRLLELFLTQYVGMPWESVDAEAEALEHVISEDLEARIDALLGYPTCDPHGDPIPSYSGAVHEQHGEELASLVAGDCAIVRRVSDSNVPALTRIGKAKLFPGVTVQVLTSGDDITLRVGAESVVITSEDAARVFVERITFEENNDEAGTL